MMHYISESSTLMLSLWFGSARCEVIVVLSLRIFISEGEISTDEVVKMLRPRPAVEMMTEKEKFVWECLMAFLDEATMKGIF